MTDPPKPDRGMDVLAWCTRVWFFIRSIKPIAGPGLMMEQTPRGTLISARRQPTSSDTLPPFWVEKTMMDDGETSAVIVHPGVVYDQKTPDGEPLDTFAPSNLLGDDGKPRKHAVTAGQSVYVRVRSLEKGQIGTRQTDAQPVEIVVDADGKESLRYQPAKGSDPEVEGLRFYKLAKFVNKDSELELELAGSHITYLRLLGRNLNLWVMEVSETTSGFLYQASDPEAILCWRDGCYVGEYPNDDGLPPADGIVDERRVVHFIGEMPST